MTRYDYLVVGAGFSGAVVSERIAQLMNKKVLLIDRRNHIGGNAFDYYDGNGILVHKYGPHIFHTNSDMVFNYLSNFTKWRFYEHKTLACVDGKLVPFPINTNTINKLYNKNFKDGEVSTFLDSVKLNISEIRNAEEFVTSQVGIDLYEKFFKHYTKKQWDIDASLLDKSVTARVPLRMNCDDRYFEDKFQYMPEQGYTAMFKNMVNHRNIDVALNTSLDDVKTCVVYDKLIYTGPIDEFFGFRFGKLQYRSIKFEHTTLNKKVFQPAGIVNYPNDFGYTRITEYKYLTGQISSKTSISYEYPTWDGDPYYPVPTKDNQEVYLRYKRLSEQLNNVYFIGRLGTYKYYNMDQVVAQALSLVNTRLMGIEAIR